MSIEQLYKCFLECSSASTDTRKIAKNSMFFALKGDHFNGNSFAEQALTLGAAYCVVDEKAFVVNERCLLVENVLETLQQLAKHHRKQLNLPIIALTGSNGKTTTKELINAVLTTQFTTTATLGNLNNHIGVPLTLLRMTKDTEIGIVEMGANHQKEIEFLCNIALPDYGLITNFGKAHLEGFGSIEGVIKGKSELYDHLKTHQKTIFVNTNDAIQTKQVTDYTKVITFGNTSNKIKIELIATQPFVSFRYNNTTIHSKLTGAYNFNNLSIAVAIGNYFKIKPQHIKFAIESYNPTNNRSQIIEKGKNTILMDAYNANPTSMMAALENFEQLVHKNKVLFLGDMFELGADAEKEHQAIVDFLQENPMGTIYLVGKNFFKTKVTTQKIQKFEHFEDLKQLLQKTIFENAFMLIKGSRGMALERVLEFV